MIVAAPLRLQGVPAGWQLQVKGRGTRPGVPELELVGCQQQGEEGFQQRHFRFFRREPHANPAEWEQLDHDRILRGLEPDRRHAAQLPRRVEGHQGLVATIKLDLEREFSVRPGDGRPIRLQRPSLIANPMLVHPSAGDGFPLRVNHSSRHPHDRAGLGG